MTPSHKCLMELRHLNYLAKERLHKGDRRGHDDLRRRAEELSNIGLSSDELRERYTAALVDETAGAKDREYRSRFDRYMVGHSPDTEMRDWLAGTQTLAWTQGAAGGFAVPMEYDDTVREGMAQTDQVLDDSVTDFSMSGGQFLQPETIVGWDLSTVRASVVGEGAQQNPSAVPPVLGAVLASNKIFKWTTAASFEGEQDIPQFVSKLVRAASIALTRQIGQSALSGKGGSDINGVFYQINGGVPSLTIGTGAEPVGSQAATNVTQQDLLNVYFSVDRFYRASKKCAWLMSDAAYKKVRLATDNQGRPLLDVQDDKEELLGKPVYVSPGLSVASISSIFHGALLFGDLSHIVIRATRPSIQRAVELGQADVTKGEAAYIARCRADAALFDPTNGVTPPIVSVAVN